MNPDIIVCPHCEKEIPLTEVLTHQISDSLKLEMEKDLRKKEDLLAKRKDELLAKETVLKQTENDLDDKVQKLLQDREGELKAKAKKKAFAESAAEMKALQEELEEKAKKLAESQKIELDLRKKSREIDEREKGLELELEKKLQQQLESEKQKVVESIQAEHHLKNQEQEKKINDMKKLLEETKRKAEQGSMQTQGEVMELDLENTLMSAFRMDNIDPVPKGVRGADVVQTVNDSSMKKAGVILWELKNTKNWSPAWIQKLKDDQTSVSAEIAILVTEAMPPDTENFSMIDNIWVTKRALAIPLAMVLRDSLIDLKYARSSAVGMSEKMQVLYQYITGPEFRQKVEGIIDTFSGMKTQLDREKRAMTKLWKEREKQIDRVVENTSGMYGDFKGVIGAALKDIESLELSDGLDDEDSDE